VRISDHRALAITSGVALAALGAFSAFALAGWPGEPNGCFEVQRPACFCERPRTGPVAQPANTASNVAFVLVGLWIAAVADRDRRRARSAAPANPMRAGRAHAIHFAAVTALLGPGSMFLHGSLTRWGGQVDVSSMYLFAALLVAYAVARLRSDAFLPFAALHAALSAVLVWSKLGTQWSSDALFGGVLAAAAAGDVALFRRRPELRRERRWIAAAGAVFAVAFAIWLPSRSGGPLCDPDRWLQGHAVWHVLCAASAGLVFVYLRSEEREEG
jgi:hypothetical protein